MTYDSIVTAVLAEKGKIARHESNLAKAKKRLRAQLDVLETQVRPALEAGIAVFNQTYSFNIDPTQIHIGFNFNKKTVSFFTRMRTSTGYEPDEEFTFDEERAYSDSMRTAINRELKKADVPLEFGSISFPTDYYMK